MSERDLSPAQVAKRMRVHPDTVRRMCERMNERGIEGLSRTPGGHWRIHPKVAAGLIREKSDTSA